MVRNGKFFKSPPDAKEGAQKASVPDWSLWQHSHPPEDSRTCIRQYPEVTHNFSLLLFLMLKQQHHCTYPEFLLMSELFCWEKRVEIVTQPTALSSAVLNLLHPNKFLLITYFHFDLSPSHLSHCEQPLPLPIPNCLPLLLQHKSCSCKAFLFQDSTLSALQPSGAELPAFPETCPSSLFCNAHNLTAFLQQILLSHRHVNNYIMP